MCPRRFGTRGSRIEMRIENERASLAGAFDLTDDTSPCTLKPSSSGRLKRFDGVVVLDEIHRKIQIRNSGGDVSDDGLLIRKRAWDSYQVLKPGLPSTRSCAKIRGNAGNHSDGLLQTAYMNQQ